MKIYLASKSPRRQHLMQQIGVPFEIIEVDVDEHWNGKENPHDYVARIALEKARAGKNVINKNESFAVIGADTSVVLDDIVLGKAESREQAKNMLEKLSGRLHYVYSSVAIVNDKNEYCKTSVSRVCFKNLSESEISNYCTSDEPLGKAGGYAIQGYAAKFVVRLEGSYSGVMGLPLYETAGLLDQL